MINFNEENHTYTNDSGKELISVTTLLKKAGISPNYDFVKKEVLTAASEKGTLIHEEIENWIKHQETGFTKELSNFITYIKEHNLKCLESELMVYNDDVAGTIDLILENDKGELILADIKTTSTIHYDSVSWQTSVYTDLYENLNNDKVIKHLQVFHFNKDGSLEVKEVAMKSHEMILKLYEFAKNTETKFEIECSNEYQLAKLYEAERIIEETKKQLELAQEQEKLVREVIIKSMKENGLTKFENDKISICIKAAYTQEKVDTKKLEEDYPDLVCNYKKKVNVKESVQITLKKQKEKEND